MNFPFQTNLPVKTAGNAVTVTPITAGQPINVTFQAPATSPIAVERYQSPSQIWGTVIAPPSK